MDRLYVVTRRDLPPGAQGTQSQHAISEYAVRNPELHRQWHLTGKNLIWLSVQDLDALEALLSLLEDEHGFQCAAFFEPDFSDALTAFAVDGRAAKYLSSLPCALRPPREEAA